MGRVAGHWRLSRLGATPILYYPPSVTRIDAAPPPGWLKTAAANNPEQAASCGRPQRVG
jgi:hypothetical protein